MSAKCPMCRKPHDPTDYRECRDNLSGWLVVWQNAAAIMALDAGGDVSFRMADLTSDRLTATLARSPDGERMVLQARQVFRVPKASSIEPLSRESERAVMQPDPNYKGPSAKEMRKAEAERIRTENAALKAIARDLHWMARRYAHGRCSYAPSLVNDHTRALLAMRVELNATGDETLWATDGDFGPPPEARDNPANVLKKHDRATTYCTKCEAKLSTEPPTEKKATNE